MAERVWLGVDYGDKRIGIAVASDSEPTAVPLETIDGHDDGLHRLGELIDQYRVTEIVLGLPRNLDGDDTPQTMKIRDDVSTRYETTFNLPVHLQDEAVTSELAKERLVSRGESLQSGSIDREAAAIILQDYLDMQR